MKHILDILLAEKFSNGFRYTSEMEIGRLRKFLSERLGRDVAPYDFLPIVYSLGTEFNGKYYFVNAAAKEKIVEMAEYYFTGGAKIIFYEEFYTKHEKWLIESNIVSDKMLKSIFQEKLHDLIYSAVYFGYINDTVQNVIESEVHRVWGDDIILNYDKLSERLIYIPKWRIERFLGGRADFIWNSRNEFIRLSSFSITEDEKQEMQRFAENKVKVHGYVSFKELSIADICERNFELSQTAIYSGIYQICFANEYVRHGKIIAKKGKEIRVQAIMEDYCRSLDKCTIDELAELERELTGESRYFLSLGYNTMIRTDKNTFIADCHIVFDIKAIDKAIEYFLHDGDYIPLKSVLTFAMFPACGQQWNLFILESYCRRFSSSFRFDSPVFSSKNAGVIIRKSCILKNYIHIMADAVSKSDVLLYDNEVLGFLYEKGYIGRKANSNIRTIINMAKIKRSQMPQRG